MGDCIELVKTCKGCGRKFEQHERMIHCPDCGKERKCTNRAVIKGYNRCVKHGGPKPESDYYGRKGKFSMTSRKALETSPLNQTAAKYLEIQSDPQASTLRPLHSILNARLMVLMGRAGIGDSSSRMETIVKLAKRLFSTHPGIETYFPQQESKNARNALLTEIEAAVHDYAAWQEIYTLIDEKRKISESEMKILTQMKALISAEDAMDLAGQLLASVTKVIDDPRKIEQIRYEFARVLGDPLAGRTPQREPEIIDIRDSGVDGGQVLCPRDIERSESEGEDDSPTVSEGHTEGGVQEG